jgi:hypothetical protein
MSKKRFKAIKKRATTALQKGKQKVVRDSYTLPAEEHAYITSLQKQCLKRAEYIRKSEILRVGLMVLRKMSVPEFIRQWEKLPKFGPGRPRKSETEG